MPAAVRGAIEDIRRVALREEVPPPPVLGKKPKKRRVPKALGDAIDAFSPLFLQQEAEWGRVSAGRMGCLLEMRGRIGALHACCARVGPAREEQQQACVTQLTPIACYRWAPADGHQPHPGGARVPGALYRQGQPEPAPAQQGAGPGGQQGLGACCCPLWRVCCPPWVGPQRLQA